MKAARNDGFTLIETLMSLFILSLAAVMAYSGIDVLTLTGEATGAGNGRWIESSLLFKRIGDDLANAINRPSKNASGSLDAGFTAGSGPSSSFMVFTRSGDIGDASPPLRLKYDWNGGKLALHVWPSVDAPSAPPAVYTLVDGAKNVSLQYLETGKNEWMDKWDISGLPAAVKVALTFGSGGTVHRIFPVGRP